VEYLSSLKGKFLLNFSDVKNKAEYFTWLHLFSLKQGVRMVGRQEDLIRALAALGERSEESDPAQTVEERSTSTLVVIFHHLHLLPILKRRVCLIT
jgi:hypothetical protein